MTTIEIVDFMKILKARNNKQIIKYIDNLLNKERGESYSDGYIDGMLEKEQQPE